jgi:hypothetical protein
MALRKVLLTDTQDTLKNSYLTPMELVDYTDGLVSTIQLASGRSEEFGGFIYLVEGGDLTVTDPGGLSDGAVYVYLQDSGTPTAVLSNTAPTYDPNKGGWYNSADKAIFVMTKAGTAYNDRFRLVGPLKRKFQDLQVTNDALIQNDLTVTNDLTVNNDFNLNTSSNGILGTVTGFDLSSYVNSTWVAQSDSTLIRIGKLVIIHFYATWTAGGGIPGTIFTGIPAAWRPASTVYLTGIEGTSAPVSASNSATILQFTSAGAIVGNGGTGNLYVTGTGSYLLA